LPNKTLRGINFVSLAEVALALVVEDGLAAGSWPVGDEPFDAAPSPEFFTALDELPPEELPAGD
jgi:hypothetical protein